MIATSDFGAVSAALLQRLVAEVATPRGLPVELDQTPSRKPADGAYLKARVEPTARTPFAGGHEIDLLHTGELQVQVLVPWSSGQRAAIEHCAAIRAAFRPQVLPSGVELLPDAEIAAVGREKERLRWDVRVRWRNLYRTARTADGPAAAAPVSILGAMAAAKELFRAEVETADLPGWPGLTTHYENGPTAGTVPTPFCAWFPKVLAPFGLEINGPTEVVPMRVIVVLHTADDRDAAGTRAIVDRIVVAHQCRAYRGLTFRVPEVVRRGRTKGRTWQTNIRLPFSIEEAAP